MPLNTTSSPPQKQNLLGLVVRITGRDDAMLVVGYQNNEHKLYNLVDETAEVFPELKAEDFVLLENQGGLEFPVGQRVVVFWDGSYEEDDMVKKRLPYEAYIVKHRNNTVYRLLYTADDTLEDRDLAKERSNDEELEGWRLVNGNVWDIEDLPVVTWTELPEMVLPVVDYGAI